MLDLMKAYVSEIWTYYFGDEDTGKIIIER